jgi:hypothetical protein
MRTISERDWKIYREFHAVALERFCQRILAEVNYVASDAEKTSHERYLAVFKVIMRRNEEIADAFDHLRRSTALHQLACMQAHKLLTDEEMAHFSPDTREAVQVLLGF